jgi:sugar O-acyltransferase (sialic acid O-acetyltransferase NeuD family)
MKEQSRGVLVHGGGGFGRELLDILEIQHGQRAVTIVDPFLSDRNAKLLLARGLQCVRAIPRDLDGFEYLIGVGSPEHRRRIAEESDRGGLRATSLVHPSATFGPRVVISPGVIVCAFARVSSATHLGDHVHLNTRTVLGPGVVVGSFTSLNPAAIIGPGVVIEEGVLVGAGAVVAPGIRVGMGSVLGAAAVVLTDVLPGCVVTGNPARRHR